MIPGYEHLPNTYENKLRMKIEEQRLSKEGISCFEKATEVNINCLTRIIDIEVKFDNGSKPTNK